MLPSTLSITTHSPVVQMAPLATASVYTHTSDAEQVAVAAPALLVLQLTGVWVSPQAAAVLVAHPVAAVYEKPADETFGE